MYLSFSTKFVLVLLLFENVSNMTICHISVDLNIKFKIEKGLRDTAN